MECYKIDAGEESPLCKKVVVVTRRNVAELANPKVREVVMNMDKLEEELSPTVLASICHMEVAARFALWWQSISFAIDARPAFD